MNRRRTGIILIILAAAIGVVFFIIKIAHSRAGEESEETAANMAVHAGQVSKATLHRFVSAYGTIEPEPPSPGRLPAHAHVGSPVAGVIAHVDCREGQKVAAGTVLFRLDSRLAEVAYKKAREASVFAEQSYERQKKLLAVGGTSQKSFQEAEAQYNAARSNLADAETSLAILKIEAPLSGTVVKVDTEPGEAVELNTVLATIIDLDRLVLSVNIPSREAVAIKLGQPAQYEPGGSAAGRVVFVGSEVDDKSDTVPVRLSVPAAAGLLPGQFLSARIICEEHANCLAVPEAAVIADAVGSDSGTIVLVQGDKAVRKPIKIGLREGGLVEVSADGLKEGQVIVTDDAYAVPDGTKIHIIQ